jgi:hypothetical protein
VPLHTAVIIKAALDWLCAAALLTGPCLLRPSHRPAPAAAGRPVLRLQAARPPHPGGRQAGAGARWRRKPGNALLVPLVLHLLLVTSTVLCTAVCSLQCAVYTMHCSDCSDCTMQCANKQYWSVQIMCDKCGAGPFVSMDRLRVHRRNKNKCKVMCSCYTYSSFHSFFQHIFGSSDY